MESLQLLGEKFIPLVFVFVEVGEVMCDQVYAFHQRVISPGLELEAGVENPFCPIDEVNCLLSL